MLIRILLIAVIAIGVTAFVDRSTTGRTVRLHAIGTDDTTKPYEMKIYWMVHLLTGPNRSHDPETAKQIQKAHIRNIERLHKEGKLIMAGPMAYNRDLKGILILDAKDSTEAASYVKTDSAIMLGRLRFEIHPWYTAKGTYIFK